MTRHSAANRCAGIAPGRMTTTRAHRPHRPMSTAPLWAAAAALLLVACRQAPEAGWTGYVEGEYVYVAAPVAGTLTALAVQRGQTVAAGAPLFRLDDTPNRAARAQTEAQMAAAQAQAVNLQSGRRADEMAVIRAQLTQAQAAATLADAALQRQRALVAEHFVSQAVLDDAATAARQAHARVAELTAQLRVAELPGRPAERAAAQANVGAAEQAREQARWREQQAGQPAPAAGLVADTFFRPGEYVAAGQPVLALLPPTQIKARFFVPETEVASLKPGDAVQLICDGCGAPIAARISRIATQAEYTPPVIYSNAQRAKLVFLGEARPGAADAMRLKPGLPLDVRRASPPGNS